MCVDLFAWQFRPSKFWYSSVTVLCSVQLTLPFAVTLLSLTQLLHSVFFYQYTLGTNVHSRVNHITINLDKVARLQGEDRYIHPALFAFNLCFFICRIEVFPKGNRHKIGILESVSYSHKHRAVHRLVDFMLYIHLWSQKEGESQSFSCDGQVLLGHFILKKAGQAL